MDTTSQPASLPVASTQVSPSLMIAIVNSVQESSCLHFFFKIGHKLDEKNFHLWRQQIEPHINVYGLMECVKQTRPRARQLCVELCALTLDNSSVQEYFHKICTIVYALASFGNSISASHHIDVILKVSHDILLEGQVGKDGVYEFPSLTQASNVLKPKSLL
ncbi:hypothetical protein KIW84_054833 [Lathyrus oleraceus]|uniref:Uncharacterized protein n=1 Tax=Pisum sativum TaxID=3888 RepID=A0A9D4WWG9_PEA|nr:hypothetical protein KIW84_054833 [Pisum sativum]